MNQTRARRPRLIIKIPSKSTVTPVSRKRHFSILNLFFLVEIFLCGLRKRFCACLSNWLEFVEIHDSRQISQSILGFPDAVGHVIQIEHPKFLSHDYVILYFFHLGFIHKIIVKFCCFNLNISKRVFIFQIFQGVFCWLLPLQYYIPSFIIVKSFYLPLILILLKSFPEYFILVRCVLSFLLYQNVFKMFFFGLILLSSFLYVKVILPFQNFLWIEHYLQDCLI